METVKSTYQMYSKPERTVNYVVAFLMYTFGLGFINIVQMKHMRNLTADIGGKFLNKMLDAAPSLFETLPHLSRPKKVKQW